MKTRFKPKSIINIILIIVIGLALISGLYILIDDLTVTMTRYSQSSPELPFEFLGYRIMVVADFHNSNNYKQIAKKINNEHPDLLLYIGDMSDIKDNTLNNFKNLVSMIDLSIPQYAVMGNHEVWRENSAEFEKQIADSGVIILNNEKISIERGASSIDLIGLRDIGDTDDNIDGSWMLEQQLAFLHENVIPSNTTIIACHRANLYPYFSSIDADIMLSGHLHGGIVRLPKVGGLLSTTGEWFPKYDAGVYNESDMTMIVSRGCDNRLNRIRMFNGPELVLVTLYK